MTLRLTKTQCEDLSPSVISIDGCLFENIYQSSKIYRILPELHSGMWHHPSEVHLDDKGHPTKEYWSWRAKLASFKHPVVYHQPCSYHLWSTDNTTLRVLTSQQAKYELYLKLYISYIQYENTFMKLRGNYDSIYVDDIEVTPESFNIQTQNYMWSIGAALTGKFKDVVLSPLKLYEYKDDTFNTDGYSLALPVSLDYAMNTGIALSFKERFGHIQELKDQKCSIGQVSQLMQDGRYILYLLWKRYQYCKPTYASLQNALTNLHRLCLDNKITKLAMPRIDYELDFTTIRRMIIKTFSDTPMEIVIYSV